LKQTREYTANRMTLPKSLCLLFLGHLFFGFSALGLETCAVITPVDTAARLGERAVLNCRQSSQNIDWTFCSRGSPPYSIADNCNLVSSAVGKYTLDKSNGACNLVIDNVTLSHLGTYTCQDLTLNDHGLSVKLGNKDENLALGKLAIQSSTFSYTAVTPALRSANFAVDGILAGKVALEGCASTNNDAPRWWAVDLGQETPVGRVRITTRNDCCPDQLQNFFIALTNVSPWTTSPPALSQGTVCKYFAGNLPAGIPIDIFCEPNAGSGRYLFVQNSAATLTICELEAYYN